MNLLNYWFEEKVKPQLKPSKGRLFLAGFLLALIFFFLGRYSLTITPLPPRVPLEEIKLPAVDLSLQPPTSNLQPEASPLARLRLLSATLIPIYEQKKQEVEEVEPLRGSTSEATTSSPTQPATRLAGLRILGEYQNIGEEQAEDIQAVVYFFNEKDQLIAKKLAQATTPFRFLPTAPEDITLYDILVTNPPTSAKLQVNLRAKEVEPASKSERSELFSPAKRDQVQPLKLKNKSLEEKTTQSGGQKITYYQFTATLINTGQETLTNPLLYIWLKDETGKVFASAVKEFTYDILGKDDELEISLPVIPLIEAKLSSYEIKLWAKEL